MVDQQELHHALPSLPGEVGLGLDLPAVHHRHGTGGHGLGGLLHLDQTHPAVASDGETVVITEPGDLHSDQSSGLEDCGARVNKDLKYGFFIGSPWNFLYFITFCPSMKHSSFCPPPDMDREAFFMNGVLTKFFICNILWLV